MHDDEPLSASLTAHAERNRQSWNATADAYQDEHGAFLEVSGGLAWGVWQIPEAELRVLRDVRGRDMLELGCGAAQWSLALARAGGRPVGLDLSDRQLEHARTALRSLTARRSCRSRGRPTPNVRAIG